MNPGERIALLNQYCVGCHSKAAKAGGRVFEGLAPQPSANAEIWEKIIRKLGSGEMPPPNLPKPDAATVQALIESVIADLDAAAEKNPNAGRTVVRRLNRTEYSNSIRDLLAMDMPFGSELPADGVAAGFDNIGDSLSMSPLLLERYLKLARKISQWAVGAGDRSPVTDQFYPTQPQSAWLGEDVPFGTRGGILIRHYFPADGEYGLRAFLPSNGDRLLATEGVRFFQVKKTITAGVHTVIVTFPDDYAEREGSAGNVAGLGGLPLGGPVDAAGTSVRPRIEFLVDGQKAGISEIRGPAEGEAVMYPGGPPILERAEISGPYNVSSAGNTPSRKRIFVCRPVRQVEEAPCASRIISMVARRAYRRNVTAEDINPLLATYKKARLKHDFDQSIGMAIGDVLVSPDFLFRLEKDPIGAAPSSAQPVAAFELASRLAFFLWSSIPDDELLDAARTGKLINPDILNRQVKRMLADQRADSLVDNFAEQWLGVRSVADFVPDPKLYPEFDKALAGEFQEELHLFVRNVLRENHSVLDLLNAKYTYVDERLAKLYGIPGVTGPGFRRVDVSDKPERGGLLGEGAILMVTSHNARTSPVLRGKWILANLLDSPPHPPPPGIPLLEATKAEGKTLTTRQQMELHRKDATCASCHAHIDPLGFALENFDVLGRFRTQDAGGEIDSSATMPSGEEVRGPQGLKNYLVSHPNEFVGATVAQLMTYALGRQLDYQDQPTVRKIMRQIAPGGYKFSDLVMGVVNSAPFRMRQTREKGEE
jgi:Protein of unknown function (DUF1592)/Protein of unknown function (DUF1588)/Protein of unknown function (DUF1587)/Protein of unknown function (DUF1585)/Protein of unknown function (DUF1595)/Planctomycete cytochrome C